MRCTRRVIVPGTRPCSGSVGNGQKIHPVCFIDSCTERVKLHKFAAPRSALSQSERLPQRRCRLGAVQRVEVQPRRAALEQAAALHDRVLDAESRDIEADRTIENQQSLDRVQAALDSLDPRSRRIVEALDWSGLAERADEPIRSFSGGMKRRLNIACAVLHKPEVLLLDEPTVGVDPQSRERIWEMLGELRKDGATLLLTTHQLDEAQQVCDRIVIVDHGKVVADGTLDELVGQTIGHQGHLTLQIDRPLEPGHPLLTRWQPAEDGRSLSGAVEDPAADLPAALKSLDDADRRVLGLRLEPPSLQAVFLHLTGRELRE